jgi:hypothetical protein
VLRLPNKTPEYQHLIVSDTRTGFRNPHLEKKALYRRTRCRIAEKLLFLSAVRSCPVPAFNTLTICQLRVIDVLPWKCSHSNHFLYLQQVITALNTIKER